MNLAGRVYDRAVIAPDLGDSPGGYQGIPFTGVFDGNGHDVENLTIYGEASDRVGLFGMLGYPFARGQIKNLGLKSGSINGDHDVGGLVGANSGGTITYCHSICDVNGIDEVGGLIGYTWGGVISNCCSTGNVDGNEDVGGLCGFNNGGIISDCYSTGDVSGDSSVGGLVGRNEWGVSNCYSTGHVSGHFDVGGLVGQNWEGDVMNCFWDISTQTDDIGSIGHNHGTVTNVHGLPTSQLQQQSTFTDWDFINVWNIGENQTYPYLRTVPAGDINKDKTVNFLDVCIIAQQWCNEE